MKLFKFDFIKNGEVGYFECVAINFGEAAAQLSDEYGEVNGVIARWSKFDE